MISQQPQGFPEGVGTLQTTRITAHGQPLDMSPAAGLTPQIRELIQTTDLPHQPMMLKQVHGADIMELQQPPQQQHYATADACWTRQPGVVCSILTADCLPVLIADKGATVVAAVHCGWRSLAAGIIEKTVKQLDCDPHDVLVWLGPCISAAVYQVGPDLAEQFTDTSEHIDFSPCFTLDPNAEGKFLADLQKIAKLSLQQLGVNHIEASSHCTIRNNDLYYSWRGEKTAQRMATMIWLKP